MVSPAFDPPTWGDITAAAERLRPVVRRTPALPARWLSDRVGGPVFIKCENLQRTGSFKIRGAYNRICLLPDASRGVVAASAGNHAQGVAYAARVLGVRATVFMPEGATLPKIQATASYGADIRFYGSTIDEALAAAGTYAEQTGAELIHPFDHPDILAGQATAGLEIVEQVPDVRTVVVCTGGGGLLAGIALGVQHTRPGVRLVGIQAQAAAAYPGSLASGHPVALTHMATMADGIAVARPGDLPFSIVQQAGIEILTVSEEQISRAVLLCLERSKLLVEPAGAAALAAVMAFPEQFEPPVVITASGGNVDPLLLQRIIRHGLVSAGRYQVVGLRIPDRPGNLGRLLATVAAGQGNVVDVHHNRTDPRLQVDEVGVILEIEVRGVDHGQEVLSLMRERGFEVLPVGSPGD